MNQQREGNAEHQEMVLKPLAFLLAVPVHKEAVRDVIFEHADEDGGADTERPKSGENSKDEQESAKAFDDHEDNGGPGRKPHALKGLDGLREPRPAEPAEYFCRPVRKHHDTERKADD